jgi:hypothetical protein
VASQREAASLANSERNDEWDGVDKVPFRESFPKSSSGRAKISIMEFLLRKEESIAYKIRV